MDFNVFLSKISTIKTTQLGGQKAQFTLAPALCLQYNADSIKQQNPKKAAVLALFYPNKDNNTHFLLTQRATYDGTHSAQISFPGGKISTDDNSLQQTALRETYEEVGVHQTSIKIIRELTDVYIPPSNFLVTPFIAFTETNPLFVINYEVEKTIGVLLSDLLDDDNIGSVIKTTSYMKETKVPCFKFNNQIIWGATAMMLAEIKALFS